MPNVPLCQEGDVSCLYAMHLVGADDFAQLFATKERYRCGMPLAGTVRPSLQFSAAPCRGRCPHRPASAILRRADILECRGGRLCAAVRDEGALQMRHAPCGYCPPAFAIFYRTLYGPMPSSAPTNRIFNFYGRGYAPPISICYSSTGVSGSSSSRSTRSMEMTRLPSSTRIRMTPCVPRL